MNPRRLVLALLLLAGCTEEGPAAPPVTAPSPLPTVASAAPSVRPSATPGLPPRRDPRTPPNSEDVTGRYHLALEQQTTAGPTYECLPDQYFMTWEFDQRGAEVGGKLVYHLNAPRPEPVEYRQEFVRGTNINGNLVLEGEYLVTDATGKPLSDDFVPVKYELRFVEATGHLTGTRNNERFYLRPLLPGNEEKCL